MEQRRGRGATMEQRARSYQRLTIIDYVSVVERARVCSLVLHILLHMLLHILLHMLLHILLHILATLGGTCCQPASYTQE